MIQLWEILGKICVQEGYVGRLLQEPSHPIVSARKEHDEAFQARVTNAGYPHMSRAELTELYRLLKSKVFLTLVEQLGSVMRRFFPATSPEVFRVLGLSTIDTTFQADIREQSSRLQSKYRFTLPDAQSTALSELLRDPEAESHYHILHLHWSPPDCVCGLSFSQGYVHPIKGGTRDVRPGQPAPDAVIQGHPSAVAAAATAIHHDSTPTAS